MAYSAVAIAVAWAHGTAILARQRLPSAEEGYSKHACAEPRTSQHHHRRDLRRGEQRALPADERHHSRRRRPGEGVPEAGWRLDAALRGLLRQSLRLAGARPALEARVAEGPRQAAVHAIDRQSRRLSA